MKILHVTNHFHPCVGGIENAVEGLCKGLLERGHISDVACLDTCAYTGGKLPPFEEYGGIKVFRFPYINLRFYKLAPGVLRLLRDYDVIHVHGMGFFSDFLGLTKPFHRKPLVLNTHGGFFHTKKILGLKRLYFIWSILPLRFFGKVIADSRSDEAMYSAISSNIEHIPNGISSDVFRVKRKPELYSLLYVGRLSRNKRIDLLIETLVELKKEVPEIRLEIVGEDWEGIQNDLERLAEMRGVRGNLEFLGKVDRKEILEGLSKATFSVSASEYEGFGISVLESMAAGCIPVVNDIIAFREFIEDGKNGFIVDFSDPQSAAVRIQGLLRTDLSNVAGASEETALRYSWDEVIGKIEGIYKDVLKSSKP